MPHSQGIVFAHSVENAADRLAADPELSILAGATWMMRAGVRHEPLAARYLALSRVAAMREIALSEDELSIGAMTTHAQIAKAVEPHDNFSGLFQAAQNSANPGVRRLATIGGNICARGFAAADLVPALLALDADVEFISARDTQRVPLIKFMARLRDNEPALVTRIIIANKNGIGAHARLTMRAGGDYPVAIASVWWNDDQSEVRVAIGSVETSARRWTALEEELSTAGTDPVVAEQMARNLLHTISGRDAVDAKGSYRVRVLPSLIRRAFTKLDRAESELS